MRLERVPLSSPRPNLHLLRYACRKLVSFLANEVLADKDRVAGRIRLRQLMPVKVLTLVFAPEFLGCNFKPVIRIEENKINSTEAFEHLAKYRRRSSAESLTS
jgi:hypothetical protein